MRMLDVVNQLRLILPKYTTDFSTVLAISSISAAASLATIITGSAHGLVDGDSVTLSSIQTKTGITAVSQFGLLFTFTTSSDHDLTFGWPEHADVTLDGFTDPAWNGAFTLIAVDNRKTFTVRSTNVLPVLNNNEKLLEIRSDGVNGKFSVTVIDPTTFTIAGTFLVGDYVGGRASSQIRVAGSIDADRSIEQYTVQGVNDLWAFVSMHDATVSKDRNTGSDAVATIPTGTSIRQRLVDGFSIFVVVNTSQQIAAETAIDLCRHDLLLPLLQSVYGAKFSTGLSGSDDFKTIFLGHGTNRYEKSIYVHQYDFEIAMDLTDDDAVAPLDTRAFRDIDYTHIIGGSDTEDLLATIDLDAVPL